MDRQRRLLAEGARQLELVAPELPLVARLEEHQQADRVALVDERDVEAGLLAPLLHRLARGGIEIGIGDLLDDDLAALEDRPVAGELVEVPRHAGAVEGLALDGVVGGARDERVDLLDVLVDDADRHVERLGSLADEHGSAPRRRAWPR